jgi:hypothetical protein
MKIKMADKISDISRGKKVFLSYLDDDDKVISGYVTLLECDGLVIFETNQNRISIPANRVLKIKEKLE